MSRIPVTLRRLIVARADNRCEYCRLAQEGQAATFHIDHIKPVAAGGKTELNNLALACVGCSLYKGAQVTAVDPVTGEIVLLFNPRQDDWNRHFQWRDVKVVGRTPRGRATVAALKMNRDSILAIRREEKFWGRHP
ncbi:MAG TPA: HNH endonuclease [Anaerolineae bacterium]|nr:HNH endonuclease [Anaerolineae bacterium]